MCTNAKWSGESLLQGNIECPLEDQASHNCITYHNGFQANCLSPDVVETAIYQFIEDERYIDDHPTFE